MRMFLNDKQMPEPSFWFQSHTHCTRTGRDNVMIQLPCIMPHGVGGPMCTQDSTVVDRMANVPPSVGALRAAFCRSSGLSLEGLLPLGCHGDGVPHQHGRYVQVFSWNCFTTPCAERVLFTVTANALCCKCGCKGRRTLGGVASLCAWYTQTLLLGLSPASRHGRYPMDTS